jgi:hypothetical protein
MTSVLPEFINHVVTGSPLKELVLDGTKVMWWRDRVEAWERGEKIAPVTMDVAWTRKCAAACNFCYASIQASEAVKSPNSMHSISWMMRLKSASKALV